MTNKELIEKLKTLPEDADVARFCPSGDYWQRDTMEEITHVTYDTDNQIIELR